MSSTHRANYLEVPDETLVESGIYALASGYNLQATPGRGARDRELGCYCGLWIVRGNGYFDSEPTGCVPLEAGTFVWLFPDVAHSYAPQGQPWTEQWVMFDGRMANAFRARGILSPAHPFTSIPRRGLSRLFESIHSAFAQDSLAARMRAAALVHQLLVDVDAHARAQHGAGEEGGAVAMALEYMEQFALEPGIEPEAIAERLAVGYSTLRRAFRLAIGCSMKEHIIRRRLQHAAQLLSLSDTPVGDIAAAVGYEDPYYFSRLFARRMGVAPTVFRRQRRLSGSIA